MKGINGRNEGRGAQGYAYGIRLPGLPGVEFSDRRQDVIAAVLLESEFLSALLALLIDLTELVSGGGAEGFEFLDTQDERALEGAAHLDLPAAEELTTTHG
jgi:hypothetical protein